MMPDWPQQQFAFKDAEGFLNHGQLDVRFPELLGRPAGLIAAEQVSAVASQGLFELGDAPRVGE
jgi:hypothetical protein